MCDKRARAQVRPPAGRKSGDRLITRANKVTPCKTPRHVRLKRNVACITARLNATTRFIVIRQRRKLYFVSIFLLASHGIRFVKSRLQLKHPTIKILIVRYYFDNSLLSCRFIANRIIDFHNCREMISVQFICDASQKRFSF